MYEVVPGNDAVRREHGGLRIILPFGRSLAPELYSDSTPSCVVCVLLH